MAHPGPWGPHTNLAYAILYHPAVRGLLAHSAPPASLAGLVHFEHRTLATVLRDLRAAAAAGTHDAHSRLHSRVEHALARSSQLAALAGVDARTLTEPVAARPPPSHSHPTPPLLAARHRWAALLALRSFLASQLELALDALPDRPEPAVQWIHAVAEDGRGATLEDEAATPESHAALLEDALQTLDAHAPREHEPPILVLRRLAAPGSTPPDPFPLVSDFDGTITTHDTTDLVPALAQEMAASDEEREALRRAWDTLNDDYLRNQHAWLLRQCALEDSRDQDPSDSDAASEVVSDPENDAGGDEEDDGDAHRDGGRDGLGVGTDQGPGVRLPRSRRGRRRPRSPDARLRRFLRELDEREATSIDNAERARVKRGVPTHRIAEEASRRVSLHPLAAQVLRRLQCGRPRCESDGTRTSAAVPWASVGIVSGNWCAEVLRGVLDAHHITLALPVVANELEVEEAPDGRGHVTTGRFRAGSLRVHTVADKQHASLHVAHRLVELCTRTRASEALPSSSSSSSPSTSSSSSVSSSSSSSPSPSPSTTATATPDTLAAPSTTLVTPSASPPHHVYLGDTVFDLGALLDPSALVGILVGPPRASFASLARRFDIPCLPLLALAARPELGVERDPDLDAGDTASAAPGVAARHRRRRRVIFTTPGRWFDLAAFLLGPRELRFLRDEHDESG